MKPALLSFDSMLLRVPAALLLFVLPFAHITALRSLSLVAAIAVAIWIVVRQGIPTMPLRWPFVIWALAGLLSLTNAIDPAYSADRLKVDLVYPVIVFATFFITISNTPSLVFLRRASLASLGTLSLFAAANYYQQGEWGNGLHNTLGEYNTYLVTILPLLITGLLPGPLAGKKAEQALTIIALLLACYCAFISKSRMLWGVLAAIGVVFLYYAGRQIPQRRNMLLLAAVAFVAAVLWAASLVSEQRGSTLMSTHGRSEIYSVAMAQIAQHPLTGTGYGREANRETYKQALPGLTLLHPHNLILSFAEQMGIGGIVALTALFVRLILLFRNLYLAPNPISQQLGISGLALCVAVLLKNTTDMFFVGHNLLLFWALCGALLSVGLRSKDNS